MQTSFLPPVVEIIPILYYDVVVDIEMSVYYDIHNKTRVRLKGENMEKLSHLVKSLSIEDREMLENYLSNLTPEEERQTYDKIKEYIKKRLT